MNAHPDIYPGGFTLSDISNEDISPGIRPLVLALRGAGLVTSDSGDGSNYREGMTCALPYPHVFIVCPKGKAEQAARIAHGVMVGQPDLIDWPADIEVWEGSFADEDGKPVEMSAVAIQHADAASICESAGWTGQGGHGLHLS